MDAQGTLFDAIAKAASLAHVEGTPQVVSYARDNGIFGYGEQAPPTRINAGIEVNASLLPGAPHAHLAYRWSGY